VALVIDLMPPGVRLDVSPTRAGSVARYVRLEYGDCDADWIADGRETSFARGLQTETARRTGADRIGGVREYLTSLFRPARRQDDSTAETTPGVDGADAPSLAR